VQRVPRAVESPTLGDQGLQGQAGGAALSLPTPGAPVDDLTREGMAGGSGAAPQAVVEECGAGAPGEARTRPAASSSTDGRPAAYAGK
jgi:hypothetical protein